MVLLEVATQVMSSESCRQAVGCSGEWSDWDKVDDVAVSLMTSPVSRNLLTALTVCLRTVHCVSRVLK